MTTEPVGVRYWAPRHMQQQSLGIERRKFHFRDNASWLALLSKARTHVNLKPVCQRQTHYTPTHQCEAMQVLALNKPQHQQGNGICMPRDNVGMLGIH